jgi:hypothetical protein
MREYRPLKSQKVFVRKTGNFNLYTWSPDPNNFKKKLNEPSILLTQKPNDLNFCSATPGRPIGFDFITTYSYNIIVINGINYNSAYVECDYVV